MTQRHRPSSSSSSSFAGFRSPQMKRRAFLETTLKTTASVSLLMAGGLPARRAFGQTVDPPLYIMFDARGGWDTSRLLDPHGGEPYSSHYEEQHILTAPGTQHRYAPKDVVGGTPQPFLVGAEGDKQDFFLRYGAEMLVLNGVDTQTNSHDVGPRHVFSGNIRQGTPAFAALVAAIHEESIGATLPMALLSTGGYDDTAGLLPPARVGSANVLLDVAAPYRVNAASTTNFARFLHEDVEAQIRAKQAERHSRMMGSVSLPFRERMHEALDRARSAEPAFAPLHAEFMALPALTPEEAANPLIPKAQVAVAAMRAGVCVSAMLSLGSFDTHGNHDTDHPVKVQQLLDAIDYTVRLLDSLGMRDRATIMLGSDFARTLYNDTPANAGRGKDHWPITSMMVMGRGVSGGRVIGLTERHNFDGNQNRKGVVAHPVKVVAGELVATDMDDPEGFTLRPPHLHDALRELAGVRTHPLAAKFGLDTYAADPLPILS